MVPVELMKAPARSEADANRAKDESRRIARRLSLLAEAGRALATPIDHASTLHIVAHVAVPNLADWAIVFLDRGDDVAVVAVAPGEVPSQVAAAFAPDHRWDHPVAVVMRSGEAMRLDVAALRGGQAAAVAAIGATTIAIVPLLARGRSLGALMIGAARDGAYEPEELSLAEELGRRAGSALDVAALFESERRTNERLSEAVARQHEADRRKDEFLAILGHELRNPLAPIVTALDLMELSGQSGFEREREVIRRQAQHLTRLVEDLLDISRVTREKLQLKRECIELWQVVSHAIEVVSPLLEQQRHRLTVDVEPQGLRVEADTIRLSQVFANLMANAAKYTEPGGQIAIRARKVAGAVEVRVEDNGNGITADLLANIFEPFVQSDRTIDRAQGGLGLGLALVKSLTQLHGGTVQAHSDGAGQGSVFIVSLPPISAAAEEDITQRLALRETPTGRVLVVDDNVDAADMLADVLRRVGFEVAVAHDAPAALTLAAKFLPSIALLDIGLPVMDGYELARHLRELLAHPPRLVALSGYGHDADLARSRAAGFDVHLGKPVAMDVLVNVLTSLPAD
ncbi:MAG: hybrid sensor histidine kinase/response regulator [Myxococcota bacterium]|nr:hybrid sensor histidine kinase/response regulator [Myxococcota bacterium]